MNADIHDIGRNNYTYRHLYYAINNEIKIKMSSGKHN